MKKPVNNLTDAELKQMYYERRYSQRQQYLRARAEDSKLTRNQGNLPILIAIKNINYSDNLAPPPKGKPTTRFSRLLLLIEVVLIIGFGAVSLFLWSTRTSLNQEIADTQRTDLQQIAIPTPMPTPLIKAVILPGGHKPPIAGKVPEPGEAGDIPAHLLPAVNAFQPPPLPTPSDEQALRIQIDTINVDSPVVQGMYDWEQLKRGVAQKIGSAAPGEVGNMALAAHNDIYGEIFRDLDQLSQGDMITVSTYLKSYKYVVRDIQVVEPTEVWVLEPTDFASATLISCYPYRVNTKRIVIFADLVETPDF